MAGRHSSEGILTKRSKIAALAGIEPKQVLTTLSHHVDLDWLREAYRRTRKDGAVGVELMLRRTNSRLMKTYSTC